MRFLAVHNFYRTSMPSGESQVFEAERDLLRARGHTVLEYIRCSDDLYQKGPFYSVKAVCGIPWSFRSRKSIVRVVDQVLPDVVHVHNTFPLISPSIFSALRGRAARVLTLHNYRLFCPAAIPMRDGKVCTACLDKRSSLPAMLYGCYRGHRTTTLPLALSVGLHRALGTWANEVDAFICLSKFQRELMVQSGLPREKVYVKPNFYPGKPSVVAWAGRKPYVVFAGRLTVEKGVINLLRAWQLWGLSAPELRLVGDGELRAELEKMALGLPVRFLGQLSASDAQAEIANARLQILPSEWFEGFPMVVREAFAFGTPAAVSNIGPLPSIVEHGKSGVVFQPANPQSLLQEVRAAWETPGLLECLGLGARREFEDKYTEEANYSALMEIYRSAIDTSQKNKKS